MIELKGTMDFMNKCLSGSGEITRLKEIIEKQVKEINALKCAINFHNAVCEQDAVLDYIVDISELGLSEGLKR